MHLLMLLSFVVTVTDTKFCSSHLHFTKIYVYSKIILSNILILVILLTIKVMKENTIKTNSFLITNFKILLTLLCIPIML